MLPLLFLGAILLYFVKLKNRSEAELSSSKNEIKALKEENEKLLRERTDAEKVLRTTQVNLVKVSKSNKDKENLLDKLNTKLTELMTEKSTQNISGYKDLTRILKSQNDNEQAAFQIHMDELNQKFTDRLKSNYNNLTLNDLRLCTYIKTGISTREIAKMTNVLPSSINVSRSRLRKKLELESKEDLFTFLSNI